MRRRDTAPRLLVVAGELSGDKAAASVARHLVSEGPLHMFGIGGDHLDASGVKLVAHINGLTALGPSPMENRSGAAQTTAAVPESGATRVVCWLEGAGCE